MIQGLTQEESEQTLCFCHNVSKGEVWESIRQGYGTFDAIQKKTKASTGCGGCEVDLRDLLETGLVDLG